MFNKNLKVIFDPTAKEIWEAKVHNVIADEQAEESLKIFRGLYPQVELRPITEFVTEGKHLEEQTRELFNAFGCFYEIYQNDKYLCIEIEDGDWKHDHGLCDDLMETVFGLKCVKEDVWEPSDDDSYSATHYFIIGKGEK